MCVAFSGGEGEDLPFLRIKMKELHLSTSRPQHILNIVEKLRDNPWGLRALSAVPELGLLTARAMPPSYELMKELIVAEACRPMMSCTLFDMIQRLGFRKLEGTIPTFKRL